MKFEKITNDKIKVILNISDLSNQNIDFHAFMSNPLGSQDFFYSILDNAKKKFGFNTKNCNIKINVLSLSNVDFIITITRLTKNNSSQNLISNTNKTQFLNNLNKHNTLKISQQLSSHVLIYCFENFNDFYDFSLLIDTMHFSKLNAKEITLYEYSKKYFLLIDSLPMSSIDSFKIYSILTDFAICVHNPDIFSKKLTEYGRLILKNNALDSKILGHC